MTDIDLSTLTIATAAKLIRSRRISSVELVETCLKRIHNINPALNAFITVTPELAIKQANQADQEISRGMYRGPLHGIPFSLKDLFYTRGVRTTAGSKILADFIPTHDGTVTERLYQAGAILVGKTNQDEFAGSSSCENPHYGPCHNPWKHGYIPGGSSGGSGSAVAAGLGLFSLGTDTVGSIRMPAALCGIVGHKPTYGLVSRYGVIPESWSLDHAGPMTRTVADAATVLEIIAGYDPKDPSSSRRRVPKFRRPRSLEGIRIGIPDNYYFHQMHTDVQDTFKRAVQLLRDLGADVKEVLIPWMDDEFDPLILMAMIAWTEAATHHQHWLRSRPQEYDPFIRQRFERGMALLAIDYVQAQRVRARFAQAIQEVQTHVDLLAFLTVPIPATPIGNDEVIVNGHTMSAAKYRARHVSLANVTGDPAVSVPCGFTKNGLPIGLMLQASPFRDNVALQAAHIFEKANGSPAFQHLSLLSISAP